MFSLLTIFTHQRPLASDGGQRAFRISSEADEVQLICIWPLLLPLSVIVDWLRIARACRQLETTGMGPRR
ncbi:MAG: hypothetical protein CMJ95_09600 [Planctomycetes bacterium]|nr:hypothetical protein [Planctomycetota bacterium]